MTPSHSTSATWATLGSAITGSPGGADVGRTAQ